jgi:hypothetical protein
MDNDDDDLALPPPIRRSPRAALERQTALDQSLTQENGHDAAAPVVPRNRSTSIESGLLPSQNNTRTNPLASHPITTDNIPGVTNFSRHRFSHPFWHELKPIIAENSKPSLPVTPPLPRRSPARLKSYRTNKRLPPHLRRQPSLETIASVTTTHSIASDEDEPDPPEVSAPSSFLFTLEDEPATISVPSDARSLASSTHSSSIGSQQSAKPAITPINSREAEPHSPRSLFQKMTHRKQSESSSIPDRLVIERKVSFDRISHPSSLNSSSQSLPLDPPPVSGLFQAERSQSGSSSEWSASNFDVSALSEAEIKKCKKKGINPALYAEMKAARKGKWTSPIAGNSFL